MSKIYIFFLFLLGLTACTAPIDIETDNSPPVIVIYGTITDTLAYQSVEISSSSPYFDNQHNPVVSGAEVTITSSENEVFKLKENDSIKGLYQTINLMAGKSGVSYRLSVLYDFNGDSIKEIYEATAQMPYPTTVSSFEIFPTEVFGQKWYRTVISARINPDVEEFFLQRYFRNDTLLNDRISNYPGFEDVAFNKDSIKNQTIYYFLDISEKDNYTEDQIDEQNIFFVQSGDRITLEFSNIEEGYLNFINQCKSEMEGQDPIFGGPASNIGTNISNGGVGYFTAVTTPKTDAFVP